jgi:YidC/Oxa1 family membrane protein insertase
MDSKNVIAAISLSAAVIILYSLFFQPNPKIVKQNLEEQKKIQTNTDTPSLDQAENFAEITRDEALTQN